MREWIFQAAVSSKLAGLGGNTIFELLGIKLFYFGHFFPNPLIKEIELPVPPPELGNFACARIGAKNHVLAVFGTVTLWKVALPVSKFKFSSRPNCLFWVCLAMS